MSTSNGHALLVPINAMTTKNRTEKRCLLVLARVNVIKAEESDLK